MLESLNFEERRYMWFQHDGCPAHYSVVARKVLNRDYNGHWINRDGPVHWPARLPNLTSSDFFLLGYLKTKVYQQMPTTRENDEMIEQIRNACTQIEVNILLNCVQSIEVRINKCIEVEGHQFKHLLNWMVRGKETHNKQVPQLWEARGLTINKHPKRIIIFVTSTSVILGKAKNG